MLSLNDLDTGTNLISYFYFFKLAADIVVVNHATANAFIAISSGLNTLYNRTVDRRTKSGIIRLKGIN